MAYITRKSDKPNMREVAGEESNPGKRGNPGKLTPASDKDIDVIKGDSSESGTNSYAKNNQKTIGNLNKIYKRYKAAKDEGSARTREKGRG